MLAFSTASYRKNVNPPAGKISQGQPDGKAILIQLRRERGLTATAYSARLHGDEPPAASNIRYGSADP